MLYEYYIEYINDFDEEVQLELVENNLFIIRHIKNPSKNVPDFTREDFKDEILIKSMLEV